jgi:glycosyltransferase involved in cell wall biosynthesis
MLESLLEGARDRGWEAIAVFSAVAEGRDWLERLRTAHPGAVRLAPEGGRRELTEWLGELLASGSGPAILHTHFTRFDLPALAAAREHEGTRVIWHVHTALYSGLRARLRNAIKYALLGRRVDAILASGEQPAASVIAAGVRSGRVEVAGNGVRTDAFPMLSDGERRAARAELGIEPGDRVLLHFGWDWFLKGGELYLQTVRELLDRGDSERLVGLTVAWRETAAGEDISRLGLGETVRVLEPRDDVRTLYAAADVFVASSRTEAEPFAVIECLLSGTRVAATDLPGHREVCASLPAARVVERSPQALADAVESLLALPAKSAPAATAGREELARRFDLGGWAERMFDRYQRVLGAQGGPAD